MVASTTLPKLPQFWKSLLETLFINKKNVNEIPGFEVFAGSNLNFTIRISTWDLAYDDNICTNMLSNLINNTINWNNTISDLWRQSNEKLLQLTEQHVVPATYFYPNSELKIKYCHN